MRKVAVGILAGTSVVAAIVVALMGGNSRTDAPSPVQPAPSPTGAGVRDAAAEGSEAVDGDSAEEGEAEASASAPQTEEEKLVNDFDDLTDKWQEASAKGVTMADISDFVKSFRKIPKARRDECVHRALNLIPDENAMLLAGILMDKTMGKEIVETVYNDILNRDEDVKKPILREIFKDKTHPCWADTAWILDVTGELPETK